MLRALILLLLFSFPAIADENTPLTYARTHMLIARKNITANADPLLPWQKPAANENAALVFDIEVRDAASLYNQSGWFDFSGISDNKGVLMAFSAPTSAPISSSPQYAPLDILFIDKQGKILQIAPSITLAKLEEEINPPTPVLAFLFLKGGTCEKLSILPGDEAEYKLFKKPPAILSVPTSPQPQSPQKPFSDLQQIYNAPPQ